MKKRVCVLLVLVLLFSCTGCEKIPVSDVSIDVFQKNGIQTVEEDLVLNVTEVDGGYSFVGSYECIGCADVEIKGAANKDKMIQSVEFKLIAEGNSVDMEHYRNLDTGTYLADIADAMNVPMNKLVIDMFFYETAHGISALIGDPTTDSEEVVLTALSLVDSKENTVKLEGWDVGTYGSDSGINITATYVGEES